MRSRRLGTTDLTCSVLGLGTWGLGGPTDIDGTAVGWPETPEPSLIETIRASLDLGVNFFDSSDMYGLGRAEHLLGRALGGDKNRVIVATKGGLLPRFGPGTTDFVRDFSRSHLQRAVDASLKRLNRDWIDLYQLHGPNDAVTESDDAWNTLNELVTQGKIRYFGVSLGSGNSNLSGWTVRGVSSVQVRYNLVHISEASIVDKWIGGCAVIARSVFEHGFLTGHFPGASDFAVSDHRRRKLTKELANAIEELRLHLSMERLSRNYSLLEVALNYALASPNISVTLVGATSAEQIRQNASIAERTEFTPDDREKVAQIARHVFLERL